MRHGVHYFRCAIRSAVFEEVTRHRGEPQGLRVARNLVPNVPWLALVRPDGGA